VNTSRCSKCHDSEATIHFTPVTDGKAQETIHLCNDCTPLRINSQTSEPKKPESFPVKGKRCDFCDQEARSGGIDKDTEQAWYLCTGCSAELRDILLDLGVAEKPHIYDLHRHGNTVTFVYRNVPEVRTWLEAANRKAIEILKQRREEAAS
jgi:hypothetical protein